jgi:hypothetical protein
MNIPDTSQKEIHRTDRFTFHEKWACCNSAILTARGKSNLGMHMQMRSDHRKTGVCLDKIWPKIGSSLTASVAYDSAAVRLLPRGSSEDQDTVVLFKALGGRLRELCNRFAWLCARRGDAWPFASIGLAVVRRVDISSSWNPVGILYIGQDLVSQYRDYKKRRP